MGVIKTAVVQLGKTPSAVSGKKSTDFDEQGEPVADAAEKRACELQPLPRDSESREDTEP